MRLISQLFFTSIFSLTGAATCSAMGDTVAIMATGIKEVWLHDNKPAELARLGMVWGFLKYHHPSATNGRVDMDAELMKVMPRVLAAANTDSAMVVIERWVDELGKPAPCKKCAAFVNGSRTVTGPDYGMLFINEMPQTLRDKLEYIKANRIAGSRQHYVQMASPAGNPVFTNERTYNDNPLPDAGTRLLGLFRYWNMVQYYSPARHLASPNRGRMLADMVIEFSNATDTLSYQLACLKLVTRINDGYTVQPELADRLEEYRGKYILPFTARFAEEQLIVTACNNGITSVKPGDIIEAIDGLMVLDIVRRYINQMPAANFQRKLELMAGSEGFVLRSNKQDATLMVTSGNAAPKQVVMKRVPIATGTQIATPPYAYSVLSGNIGYIKGELVQYAGTNALRDSLGKMQAIVLDLRRCSWVQIPQALQWLLPSEASFAKIARMEPDVPGAFVFAPPVLTGTAKGKQYSGRMVLLADATTQGAAEYLAIALQGISGSVVMGSTTAGTAGTPSPVSLPGAISTALSGTIVYYPNGTPTQGAGVRIDTVVKPTVNAVNTGKDDVLDAALLYLINAGSTGSTHTR